MATDIYLYRKDRRWQKVSKVIEVTMTSNQTAYAGITGDAATDIITVAGATLANGQIITLSAKTGGSGISLGVGYYIINANGTFGKLSLTPGGSVVALGTSFSAGAGIVSQPELSVWSSEYRDIFSSNINSGGQIPVGVTGIGSINSSGSFPGLGNLSTNNASNVIGFGSTNSTTSNLTIIKDSDEVSHAPLRQTSLNKSFWKFDRGASAAPRYLYAEYMQGDQILDNPPETL